MADLPGDPTPGRLGGANKRLVRALQEAKLSQACIEAIDHPVRREIDRAVVRQLDSCRWVAERQNVILVGATGVGKSFVACALARADGPTSACSASSLVSSSS